MHTHKFLRTLPRSLLSAAVVAGIVTAAGVFAVDGNPPGLFELDGNTVDVGGTPGDDWGSIFTGTNLGTPAASTGILADPAPLTIYTQGGSKDINDVSEWRHTNGNVPDKDDITNAYAAGYINPNNVSHNGQVVHQAGDLIIYFGLDRYANNGDAFAGFWFFQDDVGLGPNGTFQGVHTARDGDQRGDLLVLVEYPQGANAQPEIKVYEWDPADADNDNVADNLDEIYSSTNAKCDGAGNKLACAITNVNNLTNEPAWDYTPKSGPASDLPKESFFEGGINVTRLLGGATPCFSSFLAETRSSRSETAQLKDFVLGNFDLCSIAVTKTCEAEVNDQDGGNSVVVNFSGEVTNDGGLALNNVTVTDDMGTPGDTGDDQVVFGPATLQPGETQPYSGSYETTAIPATDQVTATGSRGTATVEATADATCSPTVSPAITVDKFCSATLKEDGSGVDVLFNGTVTNTGNVALENVTVVDDNGTADPGDDVTVLGPVTLNAGASMPYNGGFGVTGSNTSTDHVVASGTDVLTDVEVSDTAEATCLADTNPSILLAKQCTATVNSSGDGIDVSFTGSVTNNGNVILNNVTVIDDNGTPGNTGDDVTLIDNATLAVGASLPFSGNFSGSGSSSTDVVSATASDALTGDVVSDTETATCAADVNPAILVSKQCTATVNSAGTAIDVLFIGSVTNTGNVVLQNVNVVDDNGTPGNSGDDVTLISNATLGVGASLPFNGNFSSSSASSTDVVTATGVDMLTSQAVSDTETASCAADLNPSIAVTKQCTDAMAHDQPILFNGTVSNTGNVALLGVTVVDDNGTPADPLDDQTFNLGDLAPGASANYNGSYSPGTGTWTNTVEANANGALETGSFTATASATCDVPPPPPEFEGCTPGFWKNSPGSWVGYSPNQLVGSVFSLPSGVLNNQLGDDTLMEALGYPGGTNLVGAAQILLRAAVASLLNAGHPDVDFPLTTSEVITQVNAALATKDRGTILALASTLDGYNNLGCDLPNDNSF
ncbi:DUF7507 domain-containing protein [Pseudomonas oryzae]|uniref:DUF7507 domain-containing protein n=1 Tax=Pseudomonas oryzae TaxID=1392877 RepID=A0A1H1RUX1_9PSED|nr:hypothetical protein [Pseudomonas oryzae]SDS39433.1 hypothetical protein SAMN05216221_1722 [Pseudomonas oryzae]